MSLPRPRPSPTDTHRFWAKVEKTGTCWIWTAAKNSAGYGVFHPSKHPLIGAHRWALSQELGRPLAPTEFACHRCDNPACVRPEHLFVGTHEENMADMVAKGRSAVGERKVRTAKLRDWQVVAMRNEAASGAPLRDLAARYGIAKSGVCSIIRGDRWSHLGGPITKRYKTKEK